MEETKDFWLNNPKVLLKPEFIPNTEMTNAERLNTLTRLLLIITLGLYMFGYDNYSTVLILGLILIILLRNNQPKEHFNSNDQRALDSGIRGFMPGVDSLPHGGQNDPCWFDQNTDLLNATYEVTPKIQFNHDDGAKRSYANAKYELTPLTDTNGFKDIWRNEPGFCGGYSMVPQPDTISPVLHEEPDLHPVNYIVRSKIDHVRADPANNSLNSMRPFVEASYAQDSMDFRTSIMNEHIDRFRRERQHNCADMPLLTTSAGGGGSI